MIKQAEEDDTLVIEEILLDAVMWMEKNKLQNQWNENSIKWSSLSKDYQIKDFYIDYKNGEPKSCISIDIFYWMISVINMCKQ